MVQRAINKKAKVGLKSSIMVQNLNVYYPKNYYFFNNIVLKIEIKGTTVKNLCLKKSKIKETKLAHIKVARSLEQEDKKKKIKKYK